MTPAVAPGVGHIGRRALHAPDRETSGKRMKRGKGTLGKNLRATAPVIREARDADLLFIRNKQPWAKPMYQ